ncbi:Uncharacterized protein SCG7109_AP_00040 [Chlamydiales bacterium SCGC AG-110-M15]|nr:Uncharacterized protein SCG7109_AP_00040 [Chlamydiales bacterium SCGC AG-110-M15]
MSFTQWYYAKDGQQIGPINESELLSLHEQGKVNQATLVWSTEMDLWQALGQTSLLKEKESREQAIIEENPEPTLSTIQPEIIRDAPQSSQPKPWLRYLARQFDLNIGFLLSAIAFPTLFISGGVYGAFFLLLIWSVIESVLMTTWGTTPGKALLGIQVLKKDHTKLSFANSFGRSFRVVMRGMCFGFPFLSLGAMILAKWSLMKNGMTTWDRDGGFVVQHQNVDWIRIALVIAVFILITFIAAVFVANSLENLESAAEVFQVTSSVV